MKPRILILSNDAIRVKAKTCSALHAACERLGHFTITRDTSEIRFLLEKRTSIPPESLEDLTQNIASKWLRLIDYMGINSILCLDFDWFFHPSLFLNHPQIQSISCLWFDDIQTWMQTRRSLSFEHTCADHPSILNHPKIHHYFYGKGQMAEAQSIGLDHITYSPLAADTSLLQENQPITFPHHFAFVGNPGARQIPHPHIIEQMHKGASLQHLRTLSAQHILSTPPDFIEKLCRIEPTIRELLTFAIQARIVEPFRPAIELLQIASTSYPSALPHLVENNHLWDALTLIKLVNLYDRPAMVWRLYSKNLLHVYSAPEEWKPYGVESKPFVPAANLPGITQSYPCLLNAANPLRDAWANEKLFEIAALERASLNLGAPELHGLYPESCIFTVHEFEELEQTAHYLLDHPDELIDHGLASRKHTSCHHTWDERIREISLVP